MDAQKRPTLKTIAKITGLAVPTVSRALKGADDIGKATKERVRKVADEVGYVPNHAGIRLRTGRSHVVTMLMPTEPELLSHTAPLVRATALGLRAANYALSIAPSVPGADPLEQVKYVVSTQTADALILDHITPNDPRVRYLMDMDVPFVTHGRSKWAAEHAFYDFDDTAFGAHAVARLVARGRRTIRMVTPPPGHAAAKHMIAGARDCAASLGAAFDVIDGLHSDSPAAQVRALATDLVHQNAAGDGWIFASATACLAGISGFEAAGAALGKTLDVVVKDALPLLCWCKPEILCVHQDAAAAGAFLAQAAIARIEHPTAPPMQHIERVIASEPVLTKT